MDDPGSIPRNGTSIRAMVISHPEGLYLNSQSAGFSYAYKERETEYQHRPLIPIPGSRCSIVVSIPAYHAGDPGLIPGNGALCQAIVMSHLEAYAWNEKEME